MGCSGILGWMAMFSAVVTCVNCMSNETEHRKILDFLKNCESQLVFNDGYKNVVLVVGNTGAGKTTFTQWIAGDDSKLISVEVLKSGEYIIIDNDKIGNTTIESKTIFPELVVDNDTDTAYYDISGFSDTRGTEHDISTSYFIKRIIDQVDSIKVLLVVSHSSLRKGVDRLDFIRVLRHFTDLVKNFDRYANGIGLVVTKVENTYRRSKGGVSLVSDSDVVSSIAGFLLEVADNLKLNIESKTANLADKIFSEKAIKIINSLLYSESQSYEKIVLFRRPDQLGPLSEIPQLQEAKLLARNMVSENLQFIPKKSDDFSYTVSDETKNKLNILLKDLEKSLADDFKTMANRIASYYEDILTGIQHKINFVEENINDTDRIDSEIYTIKNVTETADKAIHEILQLASSLNDAQSSKMIPTLINATLNRLDVDMPEWIILDIASVAHFLDFIETAAILKFKLNVIPLKLILQEFGNKLEHSSVLVQANYMKLLDDVENNIKSHIQSSIKELKDQYLKEEKNVYNLLEPSEQMNNFYNEFAITNLSDSNTTLIKISQVFVSHKITFKDYVMKKIREEEKYYLFLKSEMEKLLIFFVDSQKWYKFLNDLYNKLSSYEIQKDKQTKRYCSSFIQNNNTKQLYVEKKVSDTNIEFLLRDCYNDLYNEEYTDIKDVHLTENNVKLLQDIVQFTLDDAFSQICNETKLVVKDQFLTISSININDCTSMKALEILATEKVFIDVDLDFTGKNIQMAVMAPTWEIVGERKIVLDGSPGEKIWPSKAADEKFGLPGKPGGNAGDFLGFGDNFINGDNLYISANGGDGSSGQDGGDGKPGFDANSPRIIDKNDLSCFFLIIYCTDYTESSGQCSNGGDGRYGGIGGKGGKAGKVEVFDAPFKVYTEYGKDGEDGSYGTSGQAGRPTELKKVSETKLWLIFGSVSLSKDVQKNVIKCKPGGLALPGSDGYFRWPAVPPKSEFEIRSFFIDYYDYLEQNLKTTLNQDVSVRSMASVNQILSEPRKKLSFDSLVTE